MTTPDMTGKTVLITGANSGIGKETAVALAGMGAGVVMTSRDRAKGEAARAEAVERSGRDKIELMLADFASFESVRKLANDLKASHDRLDVLVNNAGAYNARRSETVDGFETTFGVNHLGYFLLTNLLLDVLKASAPSRIVNVSSRAHLRSALDFDDLNSERYYRGMDVYGRSKLANVLFTYELARRLEGTGVTANVLHPGVVRTGFGMNSGGLIKLGFDIFHVLGKPFTLSPEQGARTSVYLSSSPEVEGVTGRYFADSKEAPSSEASRDSAAQRRLWEESERMVGLGAGSAP